MIINDYSTDLYDENSLWERKWDGAFRHLIGFTSGRKNTDFSNYLDRIYSGTSIFAEYMRILLSFNE